MAAAVDSPSSSPLGGRSQPAENGHAFTSGAYFFPSFSPTSPFGTAGAAHITPNNAAFPGAAAGMTPGKPAAQTPRRPHRTSRTRSPVAANPPPSSSAFGTPEWEPSSGTSWPGFSAESAETAAAETAETVLPQRFAQSVNLGGFHQGTPTVTPMTAKRSAHRARRPPATAGRTPAAVDSPFVREGSPMDWSPFVTTAAGGQSSSTTQTSQGTMSSGQGDKVRGTRLRFEQRADAAAAEHTFREPSVPEEDVTDGLHVDMAASTISGGGVGSTQPSLASDFSARFRFGDKPAPDPGATGEAPEQLPQNAATAAGSAAQPCAETTAGTVQSARSGSSGSSSSGVPNGINIGVRPSGSSRFRTATGDRAGGRRVTKTETAPSRGHDAARCGRADVSVSSAAAQQSARENDRAKANQGAAKPAAHVKPAKPCTDHPAQNFVQQTAGAVREASVSIEDADMPDASPCASGQTRADSNGSAAPFGFTKTALPAGVKSTANKTSSPTAADDRPDAAKAESPVNGWSPQNATEGSAGAEKAGSGLRFSFDAQAAQAASLHPTAVTAASDEVPVEPAQAAGSSRGQQNVTDQGTASGVPQFWSVPTVAVGQDGQEQRSQGQGLAGGSGQAPSKTATGSTEGFTLGSFSRMHNKKPRAGGAVRPRGAASTAQQTHAAKPDQQREQASSAAAGKDQAGDVFNANVWRSYAQQLHTEKSSEGTDTVPAGEPQSGSQAPTQMPGGPAVVTAPFPCNAGGGPNLPQVANADSVPRPSGDNGLKEQQGVRRADSMANRLRQQSFGEPEDSSTAESAATATKLPPDGVPAAEFDKAAASFGAGQQGASFGLGQAPKEQRATPRRGRGLATRSRPPAREAAAGGAAAQPPAGSAPAAQQPSFSFAWPPTSDQPSRNSREASASEPSFTAHTTHQQQQQPFFGFQPARDSNAAHQASQPASSWPAPEPPAAAAEQGAPAFSFKSPGAKGRAPSEERAAKPRTAFDWGKPPTDAPFAQPPAPFPMAQAGTRPVAFDDIAEIRIGGGPVRGSVPSSKQQVSSHGFAAEQPAFTAEFKPAPNFGSAPAFAEGKAAGPSFRVVSTPSKQPARQRPPASVAGSQASSEAALERQKGLPLQGVDRLRQRGNDAFQRGSYSRAVDLYQRAVNLLQENGVAEGLGKLYSNLAASYLQMDKPYAAIAACNSALQAEPSFFRARLRLATCHSRLGDLPSALSALGPDATSAANMAEAAGKRADLEALQERLSKAILAASAASSPDAAESSLREVEALLAKDQAPFSSALHRLSAQLLLQLGRREEAAEMCRLCASVREPGLQPPPLWPWWLGVQSAFHSGDLNSAAEQIESITTQYAAAGKDSIATSEAEESALPVADLAALARELRSLLTLKEAGNRAIKEGKGEEALQHYNAALTAQLPGSCAFVAVLFANRAAAHQSLGQATHAVADCLRATALNPGYSRAHSRLATVLSELKHRTGEADALERLQALPVSAPAEAASVAQRLRAARTAARSATPDHYKVLGLARDADAEEVNLFSFKETTGYNLQGKEGSLYSPGSGLHHLAVIAGQPATVRRAYKRSALQLHPDKALAQCRFSSRLGPHGVLLMDTPQVLARVRDNADWLFKCVGAANAAITDPAARRQLDADLAAQEGRAAGYGYSPYSPSSYYSRPADNFYRRSGGRKSSYNYGGASFYESFRRSARRPAGPYANGHGGAASDDSESEGFDYNNFY
ncbi:hypothetical protein COCSUDRAFT_58168 [Coccomyxa subellipsoidea C-169]|uniref:J domain-containing protein n=1 Tax=Coccomyxa subellipsoidea (strain C-169) TaxID=574566 RepID=I0YNG2_COCSC|nr:hypothetical protein COCSUDRAFT_58168 [Coccomyxa subellipsoidea C-169]EIE19931.1 hypothetical protein COCSUDRAFT_58168 [Coccomyxa subellipsoidea C-169]|eukprot:XP_005644475.1 hypothetical protein COCSUDRAFT_58168 [Coccomyxa subellipsoidea C-169]